MAFKFKDWLFNQLSDYLRLNDSYKNAKGEGLLQRYLRNFGQELDDELVDFIHNFTDLVDVDKVPDKFLAHLGYALGSPPDIDGTYATYRRFLKYVVSIYRIKGTLCSYDLLFNLLDLKAQVIELPKNKQKRYDDGSRYDTDGVTYDLPCEPCQIYDIAYWSKYDDCTTGTILPISAIVLKKLSDIICFLQPIDAKLNLLARAINICDSYQPSITNTISITFQKPNSYDSSLIYDSATLNDDAVFVSSTTYTF